MINKYDDFDYDSYDMLQLLTRAYASAICV